MFSCDLEVLYYYEFGPDTVYDSSVFSLGYSSLKSEQRYRIQHYTHSYYIHFIV